MSPAGGRPQNCSRGTRRGARAIRGKELLRRLKQNARMYPFDIYQARAAECQQKAKVAQSEDEKQSWLALADIG